jgi:RNA polymerase-binding transcription factor DksA
LCPGGRPARLRSVERGGDVMSEGLLLQAETAVEVVARGGPGAAHHEPKVIPADVPAPPAATSTARRRLRDELDRLTSVREVLARDALDQETEAESVGELSSIDQHPADLGSETFERERELSLIEDVEAEIADVRRALVRVDRGSYGRCEACGRQIPDERLSAVPAARFCFEHQAAAEVIRGLET